MDDPNKHWQWQRRARTGFGTGESEPKVYKFENWDDDKKSEFAIKKVPLGTIQKLPPKARTKFDHLKGYILYEEFPSRRYDFAKILRNLRRISSNCELFVETGVSGEFPDPSEFNMVRQLKISCLTPAWVEYINQMENLEELRIEFNLSRGKWREPDYAAAIADLPPYTDTACYGPLGIDFSRLALPRLKKLEIKTDLSLKFLTSVPPLPRCPNLTELVIDGGKIRSLGSLKGLRLPKLKVLSLKGHQIASMGNLSHFLLLQVLDLGDNQIAKIEGLEHCAELKDLVLSNNKISKIGGLDHCHKLRFLDLHGNPIGKIDDLRWKPEPKFLQWLHPYVLHNYSRRSGRYSYFNFLDRCQAMPLPDLIALYNSVADSQQISPELPAGEIASMADFSREIAYIVQHQYRREQFLSEAKERISQAREGSANWFKEPANQKLVKRIIQNEHLLPILDFVIFYARANEFSRFLASRPRYLLPPLLIDQFVAHAPEGLRRFVLESLEVPPQALRDALIFHYHKSLPKSDYSIL